MKYVINNSISFNMDERTLTDANGNITILSNPTSRLLSFLLEHNNHMVSRDNILEKVWSDYGLTPSGNSLNKSISLLRRALVEMGDKSDILETVPKQGFILHVVDLHFSESPEINSVQTLVSQVDVAYEESTGEPIQSELSVVIVGQERTNILKGKRRIIILTLVFISLCGVFLSLSKSEGNDEFLFLMKLDKCQVYYEKGVKVGRVNNYFSHVYAEDVISRCSRPGVVYYDDSKLSSTSGEIQTFVAVCSLNNNGGVSDCKNFITTQSD